MKNQESKINSEGLFADYSVFRAGNIYLKVIVHSNKNYLLAPISYNRRIRISSSGSFFNFPK